MRMMQGLPALRVMQALPADRRLPAPHARSRPEPPAPPVVAASAGSAAGGAAAGCLQPKAVGLGSAADQPFARPAAWGMAGGWRHGWGPAQRPVHGVGPASGATPLPRPSWRTRAGHGRTLVRPYLGGGPCHRHGRDRSTASFSGGERELAAGRTGTGARRAAADRLRALPGAAPPAAKLRCNDRPLRRDKPACRPAQGWGGRGDGCSCRG